MQVPGSCAPVGVPKARLTGDAPASPANWFRRWSEIHAARDARLRGRADEVPRDPVSGVLAGRTSPGCAWSSLPASRPAGVTMGSRGVIPVAKAAILPLRTWQDLRSRASSGRHVRPWERNIRGNFRNRDHMLLIQQAASVLIAARSCQLRGILAIVAEPVVAWAGQGGTTFGPECSRVISHYVNNLPFRDEIVARLRLKSGNVARFGSGAIRSSRQEPTPGLALRS